LEAAESSTVGDFQPGTWTSPPGPTEQIVECGKDRNSGQWVARIHGHPDVTPTAPTFEALYEEVRATLARFGMNPDRRRLRFIPHRLCMH
jgi:hypothetical protein